MAEYKKSIFPNAATTPRAGCFLTDGFAINLEQ